MWVCGMDNNRFRKIILYPKTVFGNRSEAFRLHLTPDLFDTSWELCRIDFCYHFIISLISHQQVLEKPRLVNSEHKYKEGAY